MIPEEIARVKRLYEEIDNLSRIQDRVADELTVMRRFTARRAAAAAAPARPRPDRRRSRVIAWSV